MSITRKLLKGMGLTEEQQETILEAHTATLDDIRKERDSYKADAEKLPGIKKELEDLKAAGDDGWKEKHDTVKKQFDEYKAEQSRKEARAAKETAYRKFLKDECHISEKYIEDVMGVAKLDELEMENGAIKDAATIAKNVREKFAAFVTTTQTDGAKVDNPPSAAGSGTGKTREQITAIRDGAQRRAEMAKNPHLFPELGKA